MYGQESRVGEIPDLGCKKWQLSKADLGLAMAIQD